VNLKPGWLETAIAAAVVVLFIAWGLTSYRQTKTQVGRYDTYSTFDAQRGGYEAWFDLLRGEGVPAARWLHRPAFLGPGVGTYIIANNLFDALLRAQIGQPVDVMTAADEEALAAWVRRGGHLVWLADRAAAARAGLTSGRLVRLHGGGSNPLRLPPVIETAARGDRAIPLLPSALTNGVRAIDGVGKLRIPFDADPAIVPVLADRFGIVAGTYRLGKGSVIVVTDESVFDNGRLARADNARFAYNIAAAGVTPGSLVAFDEWSHGYQSGDTWWSILPPPFRVAVILVALAGLVWLGNAALRFGPPVPLPPGDERTSQEYVRSMASLLRRGRAGRIVVRNLARLVLHAAAAAAGLPDSAPATAIARRLRAMARGDEVADTILELERLAGYERPTPAEVLKAARLAHALRKEFVRDGFSGQYARQPIARRSA
jgi:hypothetical protein